MGASHANPRRSAGCPVIIGVIGGGECPPEIELLAEQVGYELARRGAVLICGGLTGVMEAASRGAKRAGGLTIGVLPGGDAGEANPHIDIPIVTGIGYARNVIIVQSAQALIAIDGSYGTLSEIAYALQYERPVVGLRLGAWRVDPKIAEVQTPQEAVELAFRLLQAGAGS